VPPIPNYLGWGNIVPGTAHGPGTFGTIDVAASVDYAGVANKWITDNGGASLGTSWTGTITEQALADGRADVNVQLHTTNALTWVIQCTSTGCDFANGTLLFGARTPQVRIQPQLAALGSSNFVIHFINTAPGAQLPDVLQLLVAPEPGQQLENYAFNARADGALASGRAGHVTVAQTGNAARSNIQASRVVLTPPQ
jgi:hypothetical protein